MNPPTTDQTIERDHDRLVRELADMLSRLRQAGYGPAVAGVLDRSRERLAELRRELGDHIEFEERVVLPALERAAPEIGHDSPALLDEHRRLKRQAAELQDLVESHPAAARHLAARLLAGLLHHMEHEEEIVEHAARRIPPERLDEILGRFKWWNLEVWIERNRDLLAMAGLFIHVRDVRSGTAFVSVRTPVKDPEGRRDLEERLTLQLLGAEPSLCRVEVSYEEDQTGAR